MPNLPPGAYRLEIEARDSDGAWSGHGAEFRFEILPPWYLDVVVYRCLCGLIPVSLVLRLASVAGAGAQKEEHELQRVVEEKTADLRRANEELLRLSSVDALTGLANRRVFDQTLKMECARLLRSEACRFAADDRRRSFQGAERFPGPPARRRVPGLLGSELTGLASASMMWPRAMAARSSP